MIYDSCLYTQVALQKGDFIELAGPLAEVVCYWDTGTLGIFVVAFAG